MKDRSGGWNRAERARKTLGGSMRLCQGQLRWGEASQERVFSTPKASPEDLFGTSGVNVRKRGDQNLRDQALRGVGEGTGSQNRKLGGILDNGLVLN